MLASPLFGSEVSCETDGHSGWLEVTISILATSSRHPHNWQRSTENPMGVCQDVGLQITCLRITHDTLGSRHALGLCWFFGRLGEQHDSTTMGIPNSYLLQYTHVYSIHKYMSIYAIISTTYYQHYGYCCYS